MSEIRSFGLAKIEMGAVGTTGGMGTVLTPLGNTLDQSVDFTQDPPAITEIMSTENDTPEQVFAIRGKKTFKFSMWDATPDTLVMLMGGTKAGTAPNESWQSPPSTPNIEQSVKITTKTGMTIEIARGKVSAQFNYQFRKNALLQVDVEIEVMLPTDGTTADVIVTPVPLA